MLPKIKIEVARTLLQRLRGLIGKPRLRPGEGMLILRCNAVHTFFMKYPIDVAFYDRDDELVKIVRNVRPWCPIVWGGFRAVKALETASECG